jgi:hypothetical protein
LNHGELNQSKEEPDTTTALLLASYNSTVYERIGMIQLGVVRPVWREMGYDNKTCQLLFSGYPTTYIDSYQEWVKIV